MRNQRAEIFANGCVFHLKGQRREEKEVGEQLGQLIAISLRQSRVGFADAGATEITRCRVPNEGEPQASSLFLILPPCH
jgi:hypothetical protein